MTQPALFSGLFYPDTKQELSDQLSTLFNTITKLDSKQVDAVICPHAGYSYSGKQAAEACSELYATAKQTVIIIGPSHRYSFNGFSILNENAYETPLGRIDINQSLLQELAAQSEHITHDLNAHNNEHAIEVILPFLQYLNSALTIIPIVTGHTNQQQLDKLAHIIAKTCDPATCGMIASTDFSHFFTANKAESMDTKAIEIIQNSDAQDLYDAQETEDIQLCGIDATYITMKVLEQWGTYQAEHISYAHSGHITGDNSSVVGYNSFRFNKHNASP